MSDDATKSTRIAGVTFNIDATYSEGHVCTPAEAAALNQVRFENIGNNMRATVKEKLGDKTPESLSDADRAELQKAVDEYASGYTIVAGAVRASRSSQTPLDKMLKKVAKSILVTQLQAKGRKLKELSKEQQDEAIAKISARPKVVAFAESKVAEEEAEAAKLAELA